MRSPCPPRFFMRVSIRPQKVSDAGRFLEILSNPNFNFFHVQEITLSREVKFLKKNEENRKRNFEHNYAILADGVVVGGCGIKIDQHRPYIGEIGYFLDEAYWGRGITVRAVKLLEKVGFDRLGLSRIVILMNTGHRASQRVAAKSGYKREGLLKKSHHCTVHKNEYEDCFLYAKLK